MRVITGDHSPIKAWVDGVEMEASAEQQLRNVASLPFVRPHVAVMPDVHWGKGATVGSVVPTHGAIIPAAVGVDIGCGMVAQRLQLTASDLPDNLSGVRAAIEKAIPHGRTCNGGPGDRGAWGDLNLAVEVGWMLASAGYARIVEKHPKLDRGSTWQHLGTLGTGNHFVEVCLDEQDKVWVMLHSGSRGVGNRIGTYFIEKAKEEMARWFVHLPDSDLAYLPEGSQYFNDYVEAVSWAQDFAEQNRHHMLHAAIMAVGEALGRPIGRDTEEESSGVSCHHNYVAKEHHFGRNVWVTRKGAVRARVGDLGIIPGSMGTSSYIVRGKGAPQSFCSCSHGAGRRMSRSEARRRFTVEDHVRATDGVECRKDAEVIDETPGAYKDVDSVMLAQADLIDIVHTLHQVVCVKG